jgi:hypothetical protein
MQIATVEEKLSALKRLQQEQTKIASSVDDGEAQRCFPCLFFRRSKRAELGGVAVFGLKAKQESTSGLAQAIETMRAREITLESRVTEARAQARELLASGNRSAAIRALKRAKLTERQLETLQSSLLAVEQELDVLEQTQEQQQLASALSSSSKAMKKQKQLISKAEDAVDEASDVRDMADELAQVMGQLGASAVDLDEDELMAELAQMEAAPEPEPAAERAQRAELRKEIRLHEEAASIRSGLPLPSKRLPEEKLSLLSQQ